MTRVHFIGIGGSGLSAIARLLLESGYAVSGSDRAASPFTDDLRARGAEVHIGHDPAHVAGADWVVRSSAIPDDNPEVLAARERNIPVYKRADFLGRLMEDRTGIAVAGTHGKTTTTAMIAMMLTALGQDPSYIIGGISTDLGGNAHAGEGAAFVIEADEYDRMFLGLRPLIAVVTNVEHDHPDCYPTAGDFQAAFSAFAGLLPADGTLIACADDQGARALIEAAAARGTRVLRYGLLTAGLEVRAAKAGPNTRGGFDALVQLPGGSVELSLRVPGEHNLRNALAALAVADCLGLPLPAAAAALGRFSGTGRRFELRGETAGVTVIDDYGHHPTEIRATLAAARARYPGRRIWAVWQPHTYSRTRTLFDGFAAAFADADQVIVTAIYAAREAPQDFSAAEVVDAMRHPAAAYVPALTDVSARLLDELRPGDVLIVLSAGDADSVSANVLAGLRESEE